MRVEQQAAGSSISPPSLKGRPTSNGGFYTVPSHVMLLFVLLTPAHFVATLKQCFIVLARVF